MKKLLLILTLVLIVLPQKQLFAIDGSRGDSVSVYTVQWPNVWQQWKTPAMYENGERCYLPVSLQILAIVIFVTLGFSMSNDRLVLKIVVGIVAGIIGSIVIIGAIQIATSIKPPTLWYLLFYTPFNCLLFISGIVLNKASKSNGSVE